MAENREGPSPSRLRRCSPFSRAHPYACNDEALKRPQWHSKVLATKKDVRSPLRDIQRQALPLNRNLQLIQQLTEKSEKLNRIIYGNPNPQLIHQLKEKSANLTRIIGEKARAGKIGGNQGNSPFLLQRKHMHISDSQQQKFHIFSHKVSPNENKAGVIGDRRKLAAEESLAKLEPTQQKLTSAFRTKPVYDDTKISTFGGISNDKENLLVPSFGAGKGMSTGFIPVDRSCTIQSGQSIQVIDDALSQSKEVPSGATPTWNPFSSTFLPLTSIDPHQNARCLNSSFTEKFESKLALNSGDLTGKENRKGLQTSTTPLATFTFPRAGGSVLIERLSPIFDPPEYVDEIMVYWRSLERTFRVLPSYMERQECISHKMRSILVDWIAEVAEEYELSDETLHLSINYIDRFLSKMSVARTKLQLVGAASLFIASKFEETSPPEVGDLVFVTDEAYSRKEILAMEQAMLSVLEFDLMIPTTHALTTAFLCLLKVPDPARSLALYLSDLSLVDGEVYLRYQPSVIAAAAVAIARFIFKGMFWDQSLEQYSGVKRRRAIPVARALQRSFFDSCSSSQTALYEKYSADKHSKVAKMFLPHHGPWDED